MYQLGFWPQNGYLDRMDELLSMPFMKLQLGYLFEFIVSIPGTWFGIPPFVWGVLHIGLLAAACNEEQVVHPKAVSLWINLLFWPSFWVSFVWFWWMLDRKDIMPAFAIAKWIMFPCVAGIGALAATVLGERSGHASSLFMCCWFLSEAIIHVVKVTSRRMRPLVSNSDQLSRIERNYTAVRQIVMIGETAFHSFPSGDAGSAMVFSYLLHCYGYGSWVWMLTVFSCFGRIFLHAHHLLDVLAGCLISWMVSRYLVGAWGLESGLSRIHAILSLLFFISLNRFERKYIKFDVPAEFREGVSVYGARQANENFKDMDLRKSKSNISVSSWHEDYTNEKFSPASATSAFSSTSSKRKSIVQSNGRHVGRDIPTHRNSPTKNS